jgi:hypothetical protein
MSTINQIKEQAVTDTPLLLLDCALSSGTVEHWSTHSVNVGGQQYDGRVLRHNLFEMQAGAADGIDAIAQISLWMANADSHFSEIERSVGWKGSPVTVRFVFYDLRHGAATAEAAVLFQGIADSPVQSTESTFRLSVMNSLNLQRVAMPDTRVERRCPWRFPANAGQRNEAAAGGSKGKYSPFYRCGYSADVSGGTGTLNSGEAYTTCDRSRGQCSARGMLTQDGAGNATRRFGALEFVPPTTVVRSYGERGNHISQPLANEGRYNDFVPLVYGTAWYAPPIVCSKNDGNLTHMEVLLGMGEIQDVLKVLVQDIEIPLGVTGTNMTATGWFNIITTGGRTGTFNPEYIQNGTPTGDPYGSMAAIDVVVPNSINDGNSLPNIQVLVEGLLLERFDQNGNSLGESFTNNPAWIVLDLLRRCGWTPADVDLHSFASAAACCNELISAHDPNGNPIDIPRFQCNLVLKNRRTAADVVRGVRNSARLYLTYGATGLLELRVYNTLAIQQPALPDGSNATSRLDGGWPAYEFGDGTNGFSGILRNAKGEASITVSSLSTAETPNQLTVEFQNAFNEYQQDSLSVVDVDDQLLMDQVVSLTLPALGLPNFNQAARIALFELNQGIAGNTYVQFETTVRGLKLRPGDLITVTYLKEGFERQPFRITKVAPGTNYCTAQITAQIHDDAWYDDNNADPFASGSAGRQPAYGIGMPRPLVGNVLDANGNAQLGIAEQDTTASDGTIRINLSVNFDPPTQPAIVGLGIPMVSLSAQIGGSSGQLAGGATLYYAVTEGDASGQESNLSFVVRATIPAGTNTNTVSLSGLSFTSDATCFNVYRGANPSELLRIAANQPISTTFTDTGLSATLTPPPDANYDHANLYWRLELQPEYAATTSGAAMIGNSTLGMAPNEFAGATVRITRGTGATQERTVTTNDATTLTLNSPWTVQPDQTSQFVVAEAGWHLGASGSCGPLVFEAPNEVGATVEVCGRSANAQNYECAYALSPVTRWQITGGGLPVDADVPGTPVFGLATTNRGDVALATIAFQDLTNTHTISSATLTLRYWNELSSPPQILLGAGISASDTTIQLTSAGSAEAGAYIQVDSEVLRVQSVLNGGMQYQVSRGAEGSTAATHNAQAPIYHLLQSVVVIPFAKNFFGSPASGNFSYTTLLPDVRIASAELFVTNAKGNSNTATACFTESNDYGLRTLSGGQYSIQLDGYLAAQTNAAPPLVVQATHAVRDIFAVVNDPPAGGTIEMDVLQNGAEYCHLSIPGNPQVPTYSNVVNGFGMPPLTVGALITLNVVSVPQASGSMPGSDLTVTIRL